MATSQTSGDIAWLNWTSYDSGTTSATTTDTWGVWNDSSGTTTDTIWYYWNEDTVVYPVFTEKKSHAQKMQDKIWTEWSKHKQEIRKQVKKDAETTAKELLMELIGEEQTKIYEETGRLFVKGKKFDYIIRKGERTLKIEKDKVVDLCVHIPTSYPLTDNVIGLKLAIENDEDNVLKMANVSNWRNKPEKLPMAACM